MTYNKDNILSSMDNFIEKIQHLKGILLGVSISALILAPFAIGITLYLITHPKFFHLVENENEFAVMLALLLIVVLITSVSWLITGVQQFRSLSSWNKRYCNYLKKRDDLDNSISSEYNLDKD